MTRSILYRGIILSFLILFAAHFSFAQSDTARLQGTVTDPNGGAIKDASVTVKNTETGRTLPSTTNDLGYYSLSALPPGHYRIEITQKGFKKEVRELELQIAQVGVADFQLQIGDISQSITVEAGSPVIDPADSAIGDVVESKQITELPLNGRNFTQLATLIPGVTRGVPTGAATGANNNAETFRFGQSGGASLAVNGLRPQTDNFLLDGIDNNETLVNTIVIFPPADAIDEFRVQTSVAPAEFGRAGGALVVSTLKSGTNSFHGSAFEFNRNTDLNANDFFTTGATPTFDRNQFGGTIGGPVIKNKFFLFGDYEGLRQKEPAGNDVATVPTAQMRMGDFSQLLNLACGSAANGGPTPSGETPPADPNMPSRNQCQIPGATTFNILIYDPTTAGSQPVTAINPNGETPFAGNMIPVDRQNTVGLAYLNAYPAANCTVAVDSRCHTLLQNYHNIRKLIENWNDFDIRGDYVINTANSIFVRFSRARADQTDTVRLTTLPSGFGSGTNFNHPYGTSVGWTDIINPTVINEAHVGFVRTTYGYMAPFSNVALCTQLGIANCDNNTNGGIALIGGYNNEIEYTGDYGTYLIPQTSYNATDSVSWSKGKHTFKFGANIIRRQLNLYRPLAGKGYFAIAGNGSGGCCGVAPGIGSFSTGYEVSDLLAGFVDGYAHGTNFGLIGTRSWENGFFAQDDFRVTPRLTLNLGLRYDILTWPVEVEDRQANFNIVTGALDVANQNGNSRALVNNDYNNFGPHVGFAYQLTRDGKTVVRGGYGLFYFVDRGGISNQLGQNPPFSGSNGVNYAQGFRITLSGALPCSPSCTAPQLISTQATGPLPSGDFTGLDLAAPTNVSVISYLPNNRTPMVSEWNLQVQRELGVNQSVSLAYVGTHGSNLTRNYNANQQLFDVAPGTDLFPDLGSITVQDNRGSSDYHSLQAQYERRLTKGLQFLGAFTWSKTTDDSCGDLDTCSPQLYTDYHIEHALSNQDQNYRLVLSSLYELPFGRGKRFAGNISRALDYAIGGWQINGIYSLQAGLPFSVTVDGNPTSTRADLIGDPSVNPGNLNDYFNRAAFAVPAKTAANIFVAPGTSGRDILRGPGSSNMDLSVFKNFSFTETLKGQFRVQAYNLTNTPHFANPNSDLTGGNFGVITGTQPFSYRQVELGFRLTF